MYLPKVVIFDLFDTVLKTDYFNFFDGLDYLHKRIISKNVNKEDLEKLAIDYKNNNFINRDITCIEVKLIDELIYFKSKLGFKSKLSLNEIEYRTMLRMGRDILIKDIKILLEFLKNQNIPIYILSNSIFSSYSLKSYLKSFGILNYFNDVYSSSDFGYRKPHSSFFNMAIDNLKDKSIENNEIIYIGNDYEKDIIGSSLVGITPIWYNVEERENTNKIDCEIICSYKELLCKWRNL